jgi:predicted ester cyclase
MGMKETALAFFEACETGKGWAGCRQYCHPNATFSAQTGALANVRTLEEYTDWMKGLYGPCPDASYEIRSFAVDDQRKNVSAYAVFRATHSGEGGPVPPTGKTVEADYVYVMQFDGDKIRHMQKIWHSGLAMKELGWV